MASIRATLRRTKYKIMSSNLQATLKHLKTSVYNIRFVAKSLLSSSKNHCNDKSKNVHISAQQNYPLVDRLPLLNHIHVAEMAKSSLQQSLDKNAGAILKHQSQVGFPKCFDTTIERLQEDLHVRKFRSDWAGCEENFNNENKGMMQKMHNNRRENMISLNNGALTKACVAFWHASHQSNVRSYSTGSPKDVNSNVNSSGSDIENNKVPLSRKEMLKKAMKDYGSTVVIFYTGISLISFGSVYVLVSSGLDVVAILQHFGWGDSALSNKLAAGASTFVVAYAVHMAFASVRISITLAVTPFIVRYLRKKGFLKKPSGSK